MFCGKCGTNNPDTNKFCKNCGRALVKPQPLGETAPAAPTPWTPSTREPQGYNVPTPPPDPVPTPVPAPQVTPGTTMPGSLAEQSRMEPAPPTPGFTGILKQRKYMVASIICGVVSALILPYVLGAAAIVLGIWAITKKDKLGVIGIIIGALVMIVNYFYLVIFPWFF